MGCQPLCTANLLQFLCSQIRHATIRQSDFQIYQKSSIYYTRIFIICQCLIKYRQQIFINLNSVLLCGICRYCVRALPIPGPISMAKSFSFSPRLRTYLIWDACIYQEVWPNFFESWSHIFDYIYSICQLNNFVVISIWKSFHLRIQFCIFKGLSIINPWNSFISLILSTI